MGIVDVLMDSVRIGTRQDDHPPLATPFGKRAKRIGVAHPSAAVVQRDLRWVITDIPASAQACALSSNPFEVR